MSSGGRLSWEVRREDGSLREAGSQPLDSYVKQFLEIILASLSDTNVNGVTDRTGTDVEIKPGADSSNYLEASASQGDTGRSIVVGSDGTSEDISDNDLKNQETTDITHSSASFSNVTVSGSSATFNFSRSFTNNRSSDVSVKEAGVLVKQDTVSSGTVSVLIIRDTGSPITTISPTETATFRYDLEVSV